MNWNSMEPWRTAANWLYRDFNLLLAAVLLVGLGAAAITGNLAGADLLFCGGMLLLLSLCEMLRSVMQKLTDRSDE